MQTLNDGDTTLSSSGGISRISLSVWGGGRKVRVKFRQILIIVDAMITDGGVEVQFKYNNYTRNLVHSSIGYTPPPQGTRSVVRWVDPEPDFMKQWGREKYLAAPGIEQP
jgi:hypothetical protein